MAGKKSKRPSLEDDLAAIGKQVERRSAEGQKKRSAKSRRLSTMLQGGLAVFLLVLAALCFQGFRQAGGETDVTVESLQGPVQVYRMETGQWQPLAVRQQVFDGDVVRTGRGAGVMLAFPDGTRVKIAPDTSFRLVLCGYSRRTGGRRREGYLQQGRVWAQVQKFVSGDSSFNVNTPTALAGVRGTHFSVAVFQNTRNRALPDGATYVSVEDGVVSVQPSHGATASLVNARQETFVASATQGAPAVSPMNATETAAWSSQKADPNGDILADPPGGGVRLLTNAEEQFLVRLVSTLAVWLHLQPADQEDTAGNSLSAYAQAMAAAHNLQNAMETANDPVSGYPRQVGLTDLSGLGLPTAGRDRILSAIQNQRLVSYQATTNDYEILIHTRPPSNATIRITRDSTTVVPDVSGS